MYERCVIVTLKHPEHCRPGSCDCIVRKAFVDAGITFNDLWPEGAETSDDREDSQ